MSRKGKRRDGEGSGVVKAPGKGAASAPGSPVGKTRHGSSDPDESVILRPSLVERLSTGHAQYAVLMVFFTVVVFLLYAPSLTGPFVFDDLPNISENPYLPLEKITLDGLKDAAFKSPARNRPVANISFALNYSVHQYSTFGYHMVNMVIHVITGVLLFFFIKLTLCRSGFSREKYGVGPKGPPTDENNVTRRSGFSRDHLQTKAEQFGPEGPPTGDNNHLDERTATWIALAAALIWLVHPIQTQAVSYIVQRMASMAALLYLLAFVLYIRGRLIHDTIWKKYLLYAGAMISGLLAMGSKEIAITLPFFILLYEWYFFRDLDRAWLKRGLIVFVVAIVVLVPVVLYFTKGDPFSWLLRGYAHRDFTLTERVMTEFRIVVHYLSLLAFPAPGRLNLDYDFPLSYSLFSPLTTFLSLGFLVFLLVLAIYLAKNYRILSFCILWYLGNLVLESSVIGLELVYEHRNYLPSMLVFLAATLLGYRYLYQRWRYVAVGVLCVVLLLFSFWTWQRNLIWADDLLLWQDTVTKSPNKARPNYNLGWVYANKKGDIDAAIDSYRIAIEINPKYSEAYNNLGLAYRLKGDLEGAIAAFYKAIEATPNRAEPYSSLGLAFLNQGRNADAIKVLSRAIELDPRNQAATNNLGLAHARMGREDVAMEYFRRAMWYHPNHPKAYCNMAQALINQGDVRGAIAHYHRALEIEPDLEEALFGLGVALSRTEELEGAIQAFEAALRVNPDNSKARHNLEIVRSLRNRGRDG